MMLTLIIVRLALQIPLGALIGTFIEKDMAQPRAARRLDPAWHHWLESVFQALAVA